MAALPLALLCAGLAHAQSTSAVVTLPEVVVTATRVAQPLAEIVADVTVIDRDQLERSGASALGDVLSRVAGFELSRNGGPGGTSNVFIRGAENRFTAVYLDGVRLDSQSTGGVTWESIPMSQIDRIEILRGPAGAVYGSNALGGVVQLFTRKGEGSFSPYVSFGLGTYSTAKLEAGFSGSAGAWDYALGLSGENSKGFNSRSTTTANPDDDGYHSEGASVRLGYALNADNRLEATWLSNDLTAQYDSSNKDDQSLRLLQAGGLRWNAHWNANFATTLSVTESTDRYQTVPSPYRTLTLLRGYLMQSEYRTGNHLLTAALERNEDKLNNATTTPVDSERAQDAVALGYGWKSSVHSLQANLRQDQDSEFGAQTTGSVSYGYAVSGDWRVTASAGTAFRAPTLFQRFSIYGTPGLEPEKANNLELGAQYAAGKSSASVTVYRNRISNLINYVRATGSCTNNRPPVTLANRGCYLNTAEAVYQGITLTGDTQMGGYKLHGALDLQDPRDGVTGKLLPRRATHHASLAVDTRWGEWTVGADMKLSALRYDDAANNTVLPSYGLLGLYAQNRIAKDWTLTARIDNATDAVYQLTNTYVTAGRSLFVGLKWAP